MTICATVTSKGQTTIPKAFREKYGIALNGKVAWVETKQGLMLQSVTSNVDDLLGLLQSDVPYAGKKAEREAMAQYLAERHKR